MTTPMPPKSRRRARSAGTMAPPSPPPPRGDGTGPKAAFLVQIDESCGSDGDAFSGRVQHLSTLDGGRFRSPEDLLAILRQTLDRARRNR